MKLPIVLVSLSLVLGNARENLADGSEVLSVTSETFSQFEFLKNLLGNVGLDFWTLPAFPGTADIFVAPNFKEEFKKQLNKMKINWNVKIKNVESIVKISNLLNKKELLKSEGQMGWTAYHRYGTIDFGANQRNFTFTFGMQTPQIMEWLQQISSHEMVTLNVIGRSVEGRDIHQLKISNGGQTEEPKRAIFIDAHFHAREWITSASATWIINEIISNSEKYSQILSKFDFFVVPLANPDGYEYSYDAHRLWRKSRSYNSNSTCRGTDLNRNFAYYFGGENSSDDPCHDMFRGPYTFSEVETVALRDAIKRIQAERIVHAYFSIHSYGQKWLLPWGHTLDTFPDDFSDQLTWGTMSVEAIASVHQSNYITGQGAAILYPMGGSSFDWAKNEGIKYSTTLEVRDTGSVGFLLPPEEIIPTAQEIWAGIQTIANTKGKGGAQ